MAKKMRKLFVMCMVLVFSIGMIAMPAAAAPWDGYWGWGQDYSDQYEWYEVYVQGQKVASGRSDGGDMYYLGTHYTAGITADGPIVTWYITTHGGYGNSFGGTADLRNYITIPEGFTVKDYEIEERSVDGINSAYGSAYFDNAIIKITIKTIYNEGTGEEIEIPAPTSVTVNHKYYTFDAYIGETVLDGTTSTTYDATEGDSFDAAAVPTYGENTYVQMTDDADLTITVQADAAANVIDIEYLREIDTTPEETEPPTEPETEPPTEPETEPPTEPETEPPTEPETEPPTEPETEPPTEPETEPPTEPETEPPTEPETEPPTEPETEPPAEPETEPPTEPETEPPTEPETEPPTEPETEPPTEPETEPPTEPETEAPTPQKPKPHNPAVEQDDDGLIIIDDEDVPLAKVPKTGDISSVWTLMSALSAGGLILLRKKKEE